MCHKPRNDALFSKFHLVDGIYIGVSHECEDPRKILSECWAVGQVTKLKRKADRGAKLSSDEQKLVDARKQKNAKARPKAKQRARQKAKQKALANHEKCAQPTVDAILTHFANKSPNFIADKLSNNVSLARVMKHNNYTESQSKNAIFQEDIRNKVSAALIISNKPAKRTWRCDVCLVEEFDDYDKAVAHEEACKCKKQLCS